MPDVRHFNSPWNKGLRTGQKRPLLPKQVWSIRVRLEMQRSPRELAMFDLAIDSKLRASDLVRLRITDVCSDQRVRDRGIIIQKKTGRPVQFEIARETRIALEAWIAARGNRDGIYVFPSRLHNEQHMSTRQYARVVGRWIRSIGLDPVAYGTHSLRRTKAAQIYKKTGNLRAVQLLLGHTELESTVRYLGIEVDDAIAIAEQVEL
jgi:integrase